MPSLPRFTVFQYIEFFYDRKRRHGYSGNISPEEFEQLLWRNYCLCLVRNPKFTNTRFNEQAIPLKLTVIVLRGTSAYGQLHAIGPR